MGKEAVESDHSGDATPEPETSRMPFYSAAGTGAGAGGGAAAAGAASFLRAGAFFGLGFTTVRAVLTFAFLRLL